MTTPTTQQIILHADCLEVLPQLEENSIDALCSDPPYGLEFMNKDWDRKIPGPKYWAAVLRVLKPGAYGLVMCGTRTSHRLGCFLEDAGFEIRDKLGWLYGSGFPKSHNVAIAIDKQIGGMAHRGKALTSHVVGNGNDIPGAKRNLVAPNPNTPKHEPITDEAKQWEGFGTALKPAWEDIYLIRKPFKGTVAKNVLEYGTGALNIDAARVGTDKIEQHGRSGDAFGFTTPEEKGRSWQGRWPANIILDEEAGAMLDEQSGISKSVKLKTGKNKPVISQVYSGGKGSRSLTSHNDQGGASRFFYCAKAGVKEREAGLHTEPTTVGDGRQTLIDNPYQRGKTKRRNTHTTVKPLALCRWMSRLICPPGGTLIDPFAGSGSFGIAAALEDFNWLGIELEEESANIAVARIEHWRNKHG
jgi:site-specific DNA-methyltransferase (adenine-specific)